MATPTLVLIAHALATCMMAGVIWFVQIVHYPLFGAVGEDRFADYEQRHQARTGIIVGPLMLAELAAAIILLAMVPAGVPRWMPLVGMVMLALIWLSTFGVQVPLHQKLSRGFDARAHGLLVATNWGRTFLWTARGVLALVMLKAASNA